MQTINKQYKNLIIQMDFSSLYPHISMMANLHTRNKDGTGWNGGKLFKTEGYYDDKELGGMGKLLRKWYYLRLKYKCKGVLEDGTIIKLKDIHNHIGKNIFIPPEDKHSLEIDTITITKEISDDLSNYKEDRREYTIKILLNLQYGILNHPYYKLVHDSIAGGDCTRLGRQFIKYARKVFREAGYPIIYSDTDSWFFVDVFNNPDKYIKLKDKVIKDIKDSMPFPQLTFDADVDAIIKHIYFFKGKQEDKLTDVEMDEDDIINKPKGLMKKNYIYVETNDKITIKNLGIAKKNISALSKKIFNEKMKPFIIDGKIKFYKSQISNWIYELLSKDLSLIYMRKDVKETHQYKKSKTGIQYKISKQYGPGIHFMIPNKRGIGVGKSTTYCTEEEFKEYQMTIDDIDLKNVWQELKYFIKPKKVKTLFEY